MEETCMGIDISEGIEGLLLRWMIRKDMPQVLQIEHQTADPWLEADFLLHLRQRHVMGMVAVLPALHEMNDMIVGFYLFEMRKTSYHLLNFAVRKQCRRRGVGTVMAQRLIKKLLNDQRIGRTRITVDVRETELGAQLFFKSQGFKAIRVERGFFQSTGEDSFLMRYLLPEMDHATSS